MFHSVKVGTYAGSASAVPVAVGFKPKFVAVFNITDKDNMGFKTADMTADTSIGIAAAVAPVAANGITLDAQGFTAGTDASCNEAAKTFGYLALA